MRKHKENKMGRRGCTIFAALILGGVAATGCGAAGVNEADGETSPEGQVAAVVYEEAFSEMGRIQVYRDSNGRLSTGVIAGINDDPAIISRSLDHSLVKMHRNLRPGVPVPSELAAFDEALSVRTFTPRADTNVAAPSEDHNDFIDIVCRPFTASSGMMVHQSCKYSYGTQWVIASTELCGNCGDWSFFWNTESSLNGLHGRVISAFTEGDPAGASAKSNALAAPSEQPTPIYGAPAGTWGYHTWWGYPNFGVGVSVNGWANLGVTVHRYVANPDVQ